MTPPCKQCENCTGITEGYIWCEIEQSWISNEYANSDLECDLFVQKLDDNQTEKP